MGKVIRFVGILAGVMIAGAWATAYAQTGDCINQLPGCLDVSFGVNGKVTVPQGMTISRLAIQIVSGEQRIVVVGYTTGTRKAPGAWMVVRYLSNGTLDSTFGSGGIIKTTFSKGSASASSIAVQPDNKLVVAGAAPPISGRGNMSSMPTVARYNPNGTLDTTFGKGGYAQVYSVPYPMHGGYSQGVTLQLDRKIVVLAQYGCPGYLTVSRLNSNGTLDTTFNGTGQYFVQESSRGFDLTTQWIESEERIVVCGRMKGIIGVPGAFDQAALLRLTSAGLLDQSFGSSGVVLEDFFPENENYMSVAVESSPSNRIIVEGDGGGLLLACYLPNGTLDNSFGTGGRVLPLPQTWGHTGSVGIQPDGKILVADYHLDWSCAIIWSFLGSGATDPMFGASGWVTTDLGRPDLGGFVRMAQQSDGKFLVSGSTILARYWQ